MKKFAFASLLLIVFFTMSSFVGSEKITAEFTGISDNDEFIFVDSNNVKYLFREIDPDIEIDLYDQENIGSNFIVTYETVTVSVYDDEGEDTGETENILRIIKLEKL